MNQPKLKSRDWFGRVAVVFCIFNFAFLIGLRAAEEFGEISVSPNAIYTGSTFHGYAEMRVVLENRSPTKTHVVTLVYPNTSSQSYGISRLSRSVSLPPEAREVVALLQPPLPAQGDGSIRVEVDGHREGTVRAPNANNHCNAYARGGQIATVLVSRSLDFDAVARVFQSNVGAFTASKAVGPPDAGGSGGQLNCWMPDPGPGRATNWLELDFAAPQVVNRITLYEAQSPVADGWITLIGISGTNIGTIAMSMGRNSYVLPDWRAEYDLPETSQPVKKVRLEFGKSTPLFRIAVDAVQISGPSAAQWAADARASSDSSASGRRFRPGTATADEVESIRAESPVAEWSENWLAYSPFDAVVVNATDVAAMTPAVFAALSNYVQAGGNIVLLGKGELPPAWHPARVISMRGGAEFEIGFGRAFACGSENPSALDPTLVQRIRTAVRDNARYFQSLPNNSGAANVFMPVVENVKIPTRGIVLIMLAFVVVIGPVNLIYLNRIQRRTWMLWTIPAISFATTLLVFAYSLLREGITPDTRICGLTVLDQESHQAATIAGEAFYCPLTPSGGLHFELSTEATPLLGAGEGAGTPRHVDWSQAQHFQRGWLSARVPAHFHLRKSETRRERIQMLNQSGKMQVVNSLGAPIKSIWVADSDLNVSAAFNVGAGEKGGLISSKPASAEKAGPNGLLHDLTFAPHVESLGENVGKYLLPNTYVAVLDGNPFVENALGAASSPKRTKSSCVVFGILEENEKLKPQMDTDEHR